MRVVNPAVVKASPVSAQDKLDLQAALGGAPDMTFEAIRAAIPAARRARFTDGLIAQAALDLDLKVEA